MRRASSRRGISELIATLLVLAIAVSAATLFAAFSSGLMGTLLSSTKQPYAEQLALDYYNWMTLSQSQEPLTLWVRNDGNATVTLADIFIQGAKITNPQYGSNCPTPKAYVLTVQSICTITLSMPTTLTPVSGIAYPVKLVANDGTIFVFSCIAGSSKQ